MKSNQKGFSVIEALVIVAVLAVMGIVGWRVADSRDKKKTTTKETTTVEAEKQLPAEKFSTKTVSQEVSFNTAKFSFELPQGWTLNGGQRLQQDEYNGYIVSPDNKLQLSFYIQNRADYAKMDFQPSENKYPFRGIAGKTFYLTETRNSPEYISQLGVSACGPEACNSLEDVNTKLNDTYWLSLAIDAGPGAASPINLDPKDPLVTEIKAIIASIIIL